MAKKYVKMKRNRDLNNSTKHIQPLLTSPELLRGLALALDSKSADRTVGKAMDEYVRKGQYLHETHVRLLRVGVLEPVSQFLNPKTQELLELVIERFFRAYHGEMLSLTCWDLDRKSVLNDNVNLLCFIGLGLLSKFKEQLNLKNLLNLLGEESVLESVILSFEKDVVGWNKAVVLFRKQNDEHADYVSRWKSGYSLPSLESLIQLTDGLPQEVQEYVFLQLLLARVVAFLCRNYCDFSGVLRRFLNEGYESFHLSNLDLNQHDPSESYVKFEVCVSEALRMINEDRLLIGAKDKVYEILIEAKKIHQKAKLPASSRWLLHLAFARYHIANGNVKMALPEYKEAYRVSLYSAGRNQKIIIDESLRVAARCKDIRFLEKLKNQAIAFQMISEVIKDEYDPRSTGGRRKDDFVEDWEVTRWSKEFDSLFQPDIMFIDADGDCEDPESPIIIVDWSKHIKPDLRNPNRVVQYAEEGGRMRKPQILFFAMKNDFKAVKRLIQKGADFINSWKDNGESVFHFAIRHMNHTYFASHFDESLYRLVLPKIEELAMYSSEQYLLEEMLKTPYVKKQYTVLGSAIETCLPEVVKKVIELGAPVEQGHTMDKLTPLYWLCHWVLTKVNFKKVKQAMLQHSRNMAPSKKTEIMRRYGVPANYQTDSPRAVEMMKVMLELQEKVIEQIDKDQLIKIAKILLENGANPNVPHTVNMVRKRTPLMMAVESDDLELFDILMEHGGDTSLTCFSETDNNDYSCIDIAMKFGSKKILGRLS